MNTAQSRRRGSADEAGPSATETGLVSEQGRRERDALPVDDEVVLAARPCSVDRAGTTFGPRRAVLTCSALRVATAA